MTRNGKMARLFNSTGAQLNPRLLDGQQGQKLLQRIKKMIGIHEGYDGTKNPELTRPPNLENQDQSRSIKVNQGQSRSIKVNQGQSRSIMVNHGQSWSIKVNQGESRSIKVNQGESR